MEKQLETVIIEQDIKGLETLVNNGLNISEIKLVDVFKIILNDRRNQEAKKTKEHSSSSLLDRISRNDGSLALENYLDTEFIKLFISNGADIEYFSYSKDIILVNNYLTNYQNLENIFLNCFQFSIWFYDKELIKYFAEHGADVNQEVLFFRQHLDGMYFQASPLEVAYNHDDIDLMEYLISKGATITGNISDIGDSCAFKAKKLLFKSGIHPDQLFWQPGYTAWEGLPVQYIEGDHFVKLIKLFVEYGADVNRGCTINKILTANMQLNNDEILELYKLILKAGLDVNCKDKDGNTPLSILANTSHVIELDLWRTDPWLENIIVNSLIDHGTNVNVKNNIGMTPLMQASQYNNEDLVKLLLKNGADINLKSEMTAYDLSSNENIRKLITDTTNHTPQKLVKILTNFTLDKPIKYTTHGWDFDLENEYKDFDGYMHEMKKQFKSINDELKKLSPNLYKKIHTFLMETNPKEDYSWCSKTKINIGWSSLNGLKEWCEDGNSPFDFELPESLSKSIELPTGAEVTTFGEVIELFKQEIEIRRDFKNLSKVFRKIGKKLGADFALNTHKIDRQFYTDTEKLTITLDKIFDGIKKHIDHKNIEVEANEFNDGTMELKIIQIGSPSTLDAEDLFKEAEDGDFADIKANLTNLCDWSVEGSFEDASFRVNYLKSNNVEDRVELDNKPTGFTHILRFYKR